MAAFLPAIHMRSGEEVLKRGQGARRHDHGHERCVWDTEEGMGADVGVVRSTLAGAVFPLWTLLPIKSLSLSPPSSGIGVDNRRYNFVGPVLNSLRRSTGRSCRRRGRRSEQRMDVGREKKGGPIG